MTPKSQSSDTANVAELPQSSKPGVAVCSHDRQQRQACDLPDCRYCAECGLGGHTNFVERVSNWVDEGKVINEGLSMHGPDLIARLTSTISLRELARRTGLSPTYLSQVANAKLTISPGAFVRLAAQESMRPAIGLCPQCNSGVVAGSTGWPVCDECGWHGRPVRQDGAVTPLHGCAGGPMGACNK